MTNCQAFETVVLDCFVESISILKMNTKSKMSFFAAFWVILLFIATSVVALPQSDFYSFGTTAGDSSVPRGDDNSSPVVSLTIIAFPYYGQFHNQLYVSASLYTVWIEANGLAALIWSIICK